MKVKVKAPIFYESKFLRGEGGEAIIPRDPGTQSNSSASATFYARK